MTNLNPDSLSDISTQSWLSRMGGSFVGCLIGIILIPAAICLIVWNENRAVDAADAITRGLGSVVEVSSKTSDPKNNNKLVYVTGLLSNNQALIDPITQFSSPNLLKLE